MEWTDRGIVLSLAKHGETSAIVDLLTEGHGRHKGLVRGGVGRRLRGVLQPGNEVEATWRARLSEHLGHYTVEMTRARAAALMAETAGLAALNALCAVAAETLPEREPHRPLFEAMSGILDHLEAAPAERAAALVARWELGLLSELGFRLELDECAVTGARTGLAYVSPRSGKAVSAEGAGTYRDRLLPLPGFLCGERTTDVTAADAAAGLDLTGFFLSRHLLAPHERKMPAARQRFAEKIRRLSTRSG